MSLKWPITKHHLPLDLDSTSWQGIATGDATIPLFYLRMHTAFTIILKLHHITIHCQVQVDAIDRDSSNAAFESEDLVLHRQRVDRRQIRGAADEEIRPYVQRYQVSRCTDAEHLPAHSQNPQPVETADFDAVPRVRGQVEWNGRFHHSRITLSVCKLVWNIFLVLTS